MRSSPLGIITATFLAAVAATFESAMLYAALPTLIREFGDPVTAGWLVTIHMLVGAATCIVAGRLGDIRGRKRIMLILIGAAAVGSVLSAVTSDFGLVLAGRALQGLSIAVMPLSIGVLREALPAERVPVAVGLMTTAQGVGVAIGLVIGGAIIDHFNWHMLFALSAALLVVAWISIRLLVPARPGIPPKEPIDWIEGLLPAPGIAILLLGISFSKTSGWLDATVLGLVAAGIAVLALWARRSLRASEPFIDLRLLGTRNVALINLVSILLALGAMQIVFVFSTYMQAPAWTMAGLGLSATVAGLAKLPSNFLSFFAGPLSGWLTQRYGNRVPVMAGALIAFFGWIAALPLPGTLLGVIVLLCVISFGTSGLNAAIPNVIVSSVPEGRTSEAIGMMSVIRGMGSAIGAQAVAVLLASDTVLAPGGGASYPSATGFRVAMVWIASLTLIAAASAFFMRGKQPAPATT